MWFHLHNLFKPIIRFILVKSSVTPFHLVFQKVHIAFSHFGKVNQIVNDALVSNNNWELKGSFSIQIIGNIESCPCFFDPWIPFKAVFHIFESNSGIVGGDGFMGIEIAFEKIRKILNSLHWHSIMKNIIFKSILESWSNTSV